MYRAETTVLTHSNLASPDALTQDCSVREGAHVGTCSVVRYGRTYAPAARPCVDAVRRRGRVGQLAVLIRVT